ncbi:MAG: hypothetical protein ACRCZK_03550 [Oscillospiraceae bacterium]
MENIVFNITIHKGKTEYCLLRKAKTDRYKTTLINFVKRYDK